MESIVDNLAEGDVSEPHLPMSERLYEILSTAIIEGELAAGTIVTEPGLAQRYGVSRAPLREALRRLEARQLVERSPYKGMRVAHPSPQTIREFYEIREVLEGLACRRAARVITQSDVARMREAITVERRTIAMRARNAPEAQGKTNFLSVHAIIAEISGNRELLQLLNSEIWRFLRADYRRRMHREESLRKSHVEHLGILRALTDRDAELAEMLMRRHVANTLVRRELALEDEAAAGRT